ncbi:MAG: non-canonical purine NTP pyrophosphatase [bacterium]
MSRSGESKRPALLLGTGNRHKVKEISEILSDILGWTGRAGGRTANAEEKSLLLVSLLDFPDLVLPEETGNSYRENAEAKARAGAEATGFITLADDSGLEVDALSGAPGIHSARWLGEVSQTERNRRIVEALQDCALGDRRARFRCAVAVCKPGEGRQAATVQIFEAALSGFIAKEASGDGGFGYDPIFLPDEDGRPGRRTLAQVSPSQKNRISHRAQALHLAADHLSSLF